MPSSPRPASLVSSPSSSQHRSAILANDEALLETLVSHLLASKRSLSSISSVWRANEIVTAARSSLEESVVLGARTGFLRKGISDQVVILQKVRREIGNVYDDGEEDYRVRKLMIFMW